MFIIWLFKFQRNNIDKNLNKKKNFNVSLTDTVTLSNHCIAIHRFNIQEFEPFFLADSYSNIKVMCSL